MYGVGGLDHDDEHYVCWRCAWFGIFVGGSQCMSQSDSQCPTVASILLYEPYANDSCPFPAVRTQFDSDHHQNRRLS